MAGENLGEAFVTISADTSQFEQQVASKVTASIAAIQSQMAKGTKSQGQLFDPAPIVASTAKINDSIKSISKTSATATKDINSNFNTISFALNRLGSTLIQNFTTPIKKAFESGVTAASDLVEAQQASIPAFGVSAAAVGSWADSLDNSFGLAQKAALDTANSFGLLFGNIGLTNSAAANLAETLTQRAGDISSLFNVNSAKVAQDITAAIQGQSRTVRKYGVLLSETAVQQEAYNSGIAEQGANLTDAEKIQARVNIILAQTSKAQGDAARTVGTFAGQLRSIQPLIGDFQVKLGQTLAIIAAPLLGAFKQLLETFNALPAALRAPLVLFAGLLAAIGPAVFISSRLIDSVKILSTVLPVVAARLGVTTVAFEALTVAETENAAVGIGTKFGLLIPVLGQLISKISPTAAAIGLTTAAVIAFGKATTSADGPLKNLNEQLTVFADFGTKTPDLTKKLNDLNASLDFKNNLDSLKGIGGVIGRLTESIGAKIPGFTTGVEKSNKLLKEFGDAIRQNIAAGNITQAQSQLAALRQQFIGNETDMGKVISKGVEFDKQFSDINTLLFGAANTTDTFTTSVERLDAAFEKNKDHINDVIDASQQLNSAQRTLLSANEQLGDAQTTLNKLLATRKTTTEDVTKAETDLTQAQTAADTAAEHLASSTDQVTKSRERLVDAQTALNDLLAPATLREVSDATSDVERAEIALAKAKERNLEAQRKLNGLDEPKLHLEVRARTLAELKATLANAHATIDANQVKGDAVDLASDAQTAALDEEDATKALADAKAHLNDTNTKGLVDTPAIIQARKDVKDAEDGVTQSLKDQKQAENDVGTARTGVATATSALALAQEGLTQQKFHSGDPGFDDQVAAARRGIRDATNQVKDAQFNSLQTQADYKEAIKATNGESSTENQLLQEKLDLLQRFGLIQPGAVAAIKQALLDALAKNLVVATDVNGRLIIKPSLNGPAIPGFKGGGVADFGTESIARLHGLEAILPLNNSNRAWEVLSKSLPKMAPTLRARLEPVISPGGNTPMPTLRARGSSSTQSEPGIKELMGRIDHLETALVATLQGLGGDSVTVQVGATPDEAAQLRKIRREVEKALKPVRKGV